MVSCQARPIHRPARARGCLPYRETMLMRSAWLVGLVCTLLGATALGAELTARRINDPPKVDGRFDAEEWATAVWSSDFVEVEPRLGEQPESVTRMAVQYDQELLYVALDLEQSSAVVAREWEQGAELDSDDHVAVWLDPFASGTSGYRFVVNPNGARSEALVEDVDELDEDWEDLWYAAAERADAGWRVEIAIPFRTLSYPVGTERWRVNISRFVAARNILIGLASRQRNIDLGSGVELDGMQQVPQAVGWAVITTATARFQRDYASRRESFDIEPSVDAFYRIGSSYTAAATLNTDFSAAEVDQRELNLTRFELFFPERRDFFLRDANVFEFGGIEENALPFFSRRIGLGLEGQPLDIQAGARLTGRQESLSLGLMAVRQDLETEPGVAQGRGTMAVGRMRAVLADDHALGTIFTSGDPVSGRNDRLLGFDYRYGNEEVSGDNEIEVYGWWQKVFLGEGGPEDSAFGASVEWPNDTIEACLAFADIGEDFAPPLGFVNRAGIREWQSEFRYRMRPAIEWLRTWDTGFDLLLVEDAAGRLESRLQELSVFDLTGESGDQVEFVLKRHVERLDEPFELTEDIEIETGEYHFGRAGLGFATAPQRWWAVGLEIERGDYFDGRLDAVETSWVINPFPRLRLGVDYEWNRLRFDDQRETLKLTRLSVRYAFSAAWSVSSLMQYDSEEGEMGGNVRLRWTPAPGQEHFLIANYGRTRESPQDRFRSSEFDASLRLSFTFLF